MRVWQGAVAALGALGLASIAGSVAFVRVTAAGHLFDEEGVPPAPVGLVLGAKVHPDGTPSSFLAARLDLARRLLAAGKVRVLLVSGDGLAPETSEPDAMRDYLVKAGVPAEKVIADYAGLDTYDSCFRAKRIFNITDLTVITQSYHLPRAVATCQRLGLNANGVGDDSARAGVRAWRRGVLRDQVACAKTVLDLLTRRLPILGARETAVEDALRG